MKRIFLLFIILFFSLKLNAQRICGSEISNQNSSRSFRLSNRVSKDKMRNKINSLPKRIIVPVVVHIIHNGEPEGVGFNISNEQIKSQIEVLNEDFNRKNKDTINTPSIFKNVAGNAGIEFKLANKTPDDKHTDGIIRVKSDMSIFSDKEELMKTKSHGSVAWDSKKYLNIWVCNLSNGVLGYAQFPQMFKNKEKTDGVVINTECFGRKGFVKPPFDNGRTTTHEIGHWMGLYHIWGDNLGCQNGSDFCDDTPQHYYPNIGCSQNHHSCSNTGDMYMNYMDYTDDSCMNIFTKDQVLRMRYFFTKGQTRESILDSGLKMFSCSYPTPSLKTDAELWGFCKKTRFYLDNLPDGSSVDWKFNGYNSKVISEKTDEIVIDFGTEHNARVEAHITMPCGEKKTLAHICFNNAYIRNEFVYLKVIENQGRKIVAKLGLTDGTARFLKDKEANYFTITNTHDCIAEKSATENRVYISFTGYNPSITFSIKSLDNCETQTATFLIKPNMGLYPLIPSQESGKTIDNISTDIENCSNTTALAGQVYTYKRAGARKIYVDFSLTPLTNPKTNDTTRWDWSKQQPSIAHLYPNAYFECIPINNTIPYMHPLKIPATSGEIFYNSPRYVGIGDWGNVRIRFVNGCNASNWQLLQFDEYYSTNGYYVDRDKGYESPHLLRISPNPARDKVHLWIESNDDLPNSTPSFSSRSAFRSVGMPYQIKIYNLQGILVRSEEGSGDVAEISVEGLPSGIYVIHFSQKDKTYTSKIIVE